MAMASALYSNALRVGVPSFFTPTSTTVTCSLNTAKLTNPVSRCCIVASYGLRTSFSTSSSSSWTSMNSSFSGLSLKTSLNSPKRVALKVRAGKTALGCTKRSRSRKSRARTHGFRVRMQTPGGRKVLKRRRTKGRKILVTQTNPSSGKRA